MKPSERIAALFQDEFDGFKERNPGETPEMWMVEDMRFRALNRFLDEQHEANLKLAEAAQ